MIDLIWGLKTNALFDVWTFEHLLSGISLGAIFLSTQTKNNVKKPWKEILIQQKPNIIYILFLAYLWETIEHYLETGLAGQTVEHWFQGVEFWGNRLITDPLILVIGYFIAMTWRQLIWPARIASFLWLFFHIFIFPHRMYLHAIW